MGRFELNSDAQLVDSRLNKARRLTRDTQELVGICRGIVFDDSVVQTEAVRLLTWIDATPDLIKQWPANVIYERLRDVLKDGVLDQSEATDVLNLLRDIIGSSDKSAKLNEATGEVVTESLSTKQPMDKLDSLMIQGSLITPTGKFAAFSRREFALMLRDLGATIQKNPTQSTDIVVIGTLGSRDWITSSAGRKIELALKYREAGCPIKIVSEEHFLELLS